MYIVLIASLLFAGMMLAGRRNRVSTPPLNAPPNDGSVVIQGTVAEYGSNPDKDIDKLLITTNNENRWVHFPPNTAKKVLSLAPVNALVEAMVRKRKKPAPDGIVQQELLSVTNKKNGRTVSVRDVPPPPPAEGKEVEISGSILDYRKDGKENRIRAIVINRNLIRLPPHAVESLLPLLEKNKSISVKGWQRSANAGFVNKDSLTVVKPYLFVVDGVQYVIQ